MCMKFCFYTRLQHFFMSWSLPSCQVFLKLLKALCGVCSQSELTSLCFLQVFIVAY